MSAYLFTYGTLQPGCAAAEIRPVVKQLTVVGAGYVGGRLYDLGDYPGAVLDGASNERVFGTVFELPDDPSVLRALDEYEGFDAGTPDQSLFLRVLCPATLETGAIVEAWAYVYPRTPEPARLVPGGTIEGSRRVRIRRALIGERSG